MGDGRISVEDWQWFDNAAWAEGYVPVAFPGHGDAAPVTFDAMTGAAAGAVLVQATSASTFDAMTGAATATARVAATGDTTLGAMTGVATATVAVTAAGSSTFGDLVAAATGAVAVTATGTAAFGEMAGAATGRANTRATGAITFGDMVSSNTAIAAVTFGPLVGHATAVGVGSTPGPVVSPEFFCQSSAWGSSAWGSIPWGGVTDPAPGGPLPTIYPFDVFCAGPCGPIAQLLSYDEVDATSGSDQLLVDPYTLDQMVRSGGIYDDQEAEIVVNKPVSTTFTLEFTVSFANLPVDFSDIVSSHIYVGASDAAGACAGLFFSRAGLLYTGCVHYDGVGLVLDTLIQSLENSQVLVSEDEYWTIRIASSFDTGTTYIYVTKTAELLSSGHRLRYVLPAIMSSSAAVVPPDRTLILVRGTATAPSWVSFDSLCLGGGLLIPNLAPVADPGVDQAAQLCEILRLDGSRSFDPENSPLLYRWRLIDAPAPSQYVFVGADGKTYPGNPPTGFTDRFYSVELSDLNAINAIVAGDVVVIQGTPRTLQGTGADGDGFFVRTDGFVLPDSLTGTVFTLLRQNGLNTATSEKPTFYPDAPGIYKFDLAVFDGGLFSPPESVVVSVVESAVARGYTPDLSFIWGYLSDFWRLVEDVDRVEVFWQGLAQVAAAELLNLWQVDYAKSLRDIQRVHQRRWLHYDLLMQQNAARLELTTVRAVFGGAQSNAFALAGVSGISGTHLDIQLASRREPVVVDFPAADPYTASELQVLIQEAVIRADGRMRVRLLPGAGSGGCLRIDALFEFIVLPTSTFPLFALGDYNGPPAGTAGSAVGIRTYRVDRSLQDLDVQANDFLCIDGVAYRIGRVLDDPSDPFRMQRLVLLDALPLTAGPTWCISGTATAEDLDFWAGLCEQGDGVTFEVLRIADQQLLDVPSVALGSSSALSRSLPCDASPVGLYLAEPDVYSVFLKSVRRRKYIPIDPLIVDVPLLQEKIVSKDDTQVLRRNVDYFLETFRDQPCLRFVTPVPANAGGPDVWDGAPPPDRMWAETSYLDNKARIEQNFGIPAEFTLDDLSQLPSNVDYLSSVRGLWFAYFNGPTVHNLRVGVQILLGLPFAEEAGTIVEVRNDFSDSTGRILIQDLANTAITRSYAFPKTLQLETNADTGSAYKVGDVVTQFAPLVTGVAVIDYVKDPQWFVGYLNQGVFFEVEKFFKFLVTVDAAAFNLSALLFVQTFVRRIKPTYTFPMFVVTAPVADAEVSVTDDVTPAGHLYLFESIYHKPHVKGVTTMFDDPRAAGGGWRGAFDHNNDPTSTPTFPTPGVPISWGFDKNYLAPEDVIGAAAAQKYRLDPLPVLDDMPFLRFDQPAVDIEGMVFALGPVEYIAATDTETGPTQTVPATATWNYCLVEATVFSEASPNTFQVTIKQNGVTAATVPVTLALGDSIQPLVINVPVTAGDVIEVRLTSTTDSDVATHIQKLMITLSHATPWAFDTNLPANTYFTYREL